MLATLTLEALLEHSLSKYASRPALGFVGQEPVTYAQFGEHVSDLSNILRQRGVARGDRVVLLGENMPNWAVAYFAVTTMGAVAVPVLPEFPPASIKHIIHHSEARTVLVSQRLLDKLDDEMTSGLHTVILLDDLSLVKHTESRWQEAVVAGRREFSRLRDAAAKRMSRIKDHGPAEDQDAIAEDDLAAIVYTSGTTGHSKGVMLSHRNIVANAMNGNVVGIVEEGDRMLSVLPLAHTFECSLGLVIPLLSGAEVHYLDKPPTARALLPAMELVKPTKMLTVPLIIEKIYKLRVEPKLTASPAGRLLMKFPLTRRLLHRAAGRKLYKAFGGCLNFFGIGGSALAPEVERFLRDARFPYAIGYGMTECSPLVAGANAANTRFRSTGPAIPGTKLVIRDPDPTTGEGEILVRGPSVMLGYYKDPERTAEALQDGWLLTGDLGALDADGYLYFKGRSKNVIVGPSGENIYPEEIEYVLNASPFILESLAFEQAGRIIARVHLNYEKLEERFKGLGVSESKLRERIHQFMEELRTEANANLPSAARLHKLIEQEEPFEKTPTHKIRRVLYVDPR